MNYSAKSIRSFLGAKNYKESIRFYETLGFSVKSLGPKMSLVEISDNTFFYLQDAYIKEWVDNSMMFLEVEDLQAHWEAIKILGLPDKFPEVRLSSIQNNDWGKEFFLHDPSGILWHIGVFNK